jgi:anti-anti-sigma factor
MAEGGRLMDEFEVTLFCVQGCQLVRVFGDLDADTAPWLEQRLDQAEGSVPAVVDLSPERFLTSAGLVVLLRERQFQRPALYCPNGTVAAKMLKIVQVHRLVPIYRDLESALSASARA